jgi:VWFA-related protein
MTSPFRALTHTSAASRDRLGAVLRHVTKAAALLVLLATALPSHSNGGQPQQQEMTTHDEPATFRATTNLVTVPVVVRDAKGHPIGDLKQEDFQLFDRSKPQVIVKFSVEKRDGAETVVPPQPSLPGVAVAALPIADSIPDRFVAYLFDDVHAGTNDLIMARDAAGRHMKTQLRPKDRAAIYTTSGQTMLDFTDDRDKLHETLFRLQPRPVALAMTRECPDLTYFWADRIRNQNDQEALGFALTEATGCGPPMAAGTMVRSAVARVIARYEQDSRVPLDVLRKAVQRMSVLPGQRTLVLVSPGFLLVETRFEESTIIDRAIRANVTINTLDVRGLATETPDLSKPPIQLAGGANASAYFSYRQRMDHEVFEAQSDVLAELADGTGGTFFHNNNDLDEGYRRVAGAPEYTYILGFSPQNLKFDGSLHSLKVALRNHASLDVEARRHYTAPRSISDPAEVAQEEIREALFSRDELHDFPVELHTEYFKSSSQSARLSLLAHIDLKTLKFRKEEGRNRDDFTVVAGLFDHNGNYVAGTQKNVDLRILDANLERWLNSGITVPASFVVKPGAYMLRLVVRDSTGQLMAAHNGVVEIP